ncbi:copper chaperone PCu(A)C [Streptomyces sp. NPDC051776]|uniref:copper chaperone PCu(A)C n=1 Tax=Streptomyces sp. NPDC051776 TaxID=3155414 RepID=UPI0034398649
MSRRTTGLAGALAVTVAFALSGCSESGSGAGADLKAEGAYVPQPVMADMASGYLVVRNTGDAEDRLTSVTSDLSDDVTMHRTTGGTMERVDSLRIPAGGALKLARGGSHLMFMKLKHKPRKGEKVSVRLHFAKSDPIELDVPVEAAGFAPRK